MSNEQHNKLVAAFKQANLTAKPNCTEAAALIGEERVAGKDLNAAWAEFKEGSSNENPENTKATNSQANQTQAEEVSGLYVRTLPGLKSFRRAGYGFNEQGMGFADGVLSDELVEQLEEEPNLIVERVTFPVDADYRIIEAAE